MLLGAIFLLLSPLLLIIGLLFGTRSMSQDEIGLMKVLLVHTAVIVPFDDRVFIVRSLNRV
jgi:hypothetical protein